MPLIATTIDLPEEIYDAAVALAAAEGRDYNDLITEAIAAMLTRRSCRFPGDIPEDILWPDFDGVSGVPLSDADRAFLAGMVDFSPVLG
jgi:hypothetical protein